MSTVEPPVQLEMRFLFTAESWPKTVWKKAFWLGHLLGRPKHRVRLGVWLGISIRRTGHAINIHKRTI